MSNPAKFSPGTTVYHWDLFCGWNQVEVIGYNADTDEYDLRENDPVCPFDFTDSALFVHAEINDEAIKNAVYISRKLSE